MLSQIVIVSHFFYKLLADQKQCKMNKKHKTNEYSQDLIVCWEILPKWIKTTNVSTVETENWLQQAVSTCYILSIFNISNWHYLSLIPSIWMQPFLHSYLSNFSAWNCVCARVSVWVCMCQWTHNTSNTISEN